MRLGVTSRRRNRYQNYHSSTSQRYLNIYTRFCSSGESAKKWVGSGADEMRRWPRGCARWFVGVIFRRRRRRRIGASRHARTPRTKASLTVCRQLDASAQKRRHVRGGGARRFLEGDRGRGGVAPWPRRRVGPRCGF